LTLLKKVRRPALLSLFLLLVLFSCSSRDKENFSEAVWADQVEEETRIQDLYAPHHENGRFFAPWMKMPDKSFLDVMGWKLFYKEKFTKEEEAFLPGIIPDTAQRLARTQGDFILWIGHNTFLIRINDAYFLTDPMFSNRALLPARLTPPALSLEEVNALVKDPTIIISHNHYDHLDSASMKALPDTAAVFVPKGLKDLVLDMNKTHVVEMDWWDEVELGKGSRLICLPAQHWSMRIGQGRNKTLWASYLLVTPAATLYLGGDSGYFKGFREIGRKFPGIGYAFMATTAYRPRWFMNYQHMNIEEAVKGFDELGARFFIPTQWGAFHLGEEPAGFPGLDLQRHIKDRGLDPARFKIMDIGEIFEIGPAPAS
jgi:L-ascorbate metabolism protein UlaG (beta-lactamase superfamily)